MNVINLYISLLCFFHVKCSIDSVFSTWEQLVVFRFKFVSFVNKKNLFFRSSAQLTVSSHLGTGWWAVGTAASGLLN